MRFGSLHNHTDYSNVKGNFMFDVYQRFLDVVLSVIGLLVGIPLMIVFGILINFELIFFFC